MKPPDGITGKALCECCGNYIHNYWRSGGRECCSAAWIHGSCPPPDDCMWWIPKEVPVKPRTCLQCKNRIMGQSNCKKGNWVQDKAVWSISLGTHWVDTCPDFTQEETPMSEYLQVRKDKVMALAGKGCQFKEAMETLWPEEFEEKPLIGRMGDIYKRNDDLYLLARTEIGAKDLYILINLPDGNLWDTPFPATFAHKITLPESFTKDAHVELMTGKIILER